MGCWSLHACCPSRLKLNDANLFFLWPESFIISLSFLGNDCICGVDPCHFEFSFPLSCLQWYSISSSYGFEVSLIPLSCLSAAGREQIVSLQTWPAVTGLEEKFRFCVLSFIVIMIYVICL